jgi:hypothetical protein
LKSLSGLFPFCCLAASAVFFWGCSPPLTPFDANVPAQVLTYVGAPPVKDARTRFREIFCGLLEKDREPLGLGVGCDDVLWRLNDEPKGIGKPKSLPDHDPNMRILMVPGAFSECFGDIGMPYQEPAERLRKLGYRIETVKIGGLSSSARNAEIIAATVASQKETPSGPLVLLGYSKGTIDILHFLVTYPDQATRVRAVLSVSGAVNGSPLADRYYKVGYDDWLAGLFPGSCSSGDGGVLDSLSRVNQFRWLATHPLPDHVSYFSLATFARYRDMQLFQQPTYKLLERIDPLNDGQLLFLDQLIPGSWLLGYVNADHWTVAVPVEDTFSNRPSALRDRNRKLRDLLFEAMVLFLAERLEAGDRGGDDFLSTPDLD